MRLWAFLLYLLPALAQTDSATGLPPDLLLLAKIKVRAEQTLTKQPNYTCLETIERSRRRPSSKRFELIDALRLEVALVDGREMFAWPGQKQFQNTELRKLISEGAIGNGSFALHARAVFLTHAPTFTYKGEEDLDGLHLHRFDFKVPQLLSGYTLRVGEAEGITGYHGTFWARTDNLDLHRLQVIADSIPPHLPLRAAGDQTEYKRFRIGESDFLLPSAGEMTLTDLDGTENRNRITFSGCRQYAGESVVSFDEPATEGTTLPAITKGEGQLPPGAQFSLSLVTPVDSQNAIVGQPVEAKLSGNIKRNKQVVIPKGAAIRGRLVKLERRGNFFIVGLEFETIEFENTQVPFRATFQGLSAAMNPALNAPRQYPPLPQGDSQAVFYFFGNRVALSPGLILNWRSLETP
jgi:hypothetical protein